MTSQPALFIGRFQPFHNGHLSVVKQALAQHKKLLIGIGSAEDDYLASNPFTAGERWEMIDLALQESGVAPSQYAIAPIRNINHYALWVEHVEKLLPPFEVVYTGSAIVKQLFLDHGKHPVIDARFEHDIDGTRIRELMKKNDPSWENHVPHAVANYLKTTQKITRIKIV